MNNAPTADVSIMEMIAANPLLKELSGEQYQNQSSSPYGYLYDPECPEMMRVDEESSSTVRFIFHQFLSGIELNQIATALTVNGIASPSKRRKQLGITQKKSSATECWDTISLHSILTNPVYIGDHIYSIPKISKYIREQTELEALIPSGTIIHNHHEAIISTVEFERAGILFHCQTKAYKARKIKNPEPKLPPPPFCNAVFCGECGRAMTYTRNGNQCSHRFTAYVCSSRRSKREDACPRILYKTDDIVATARKAILKERDFARTIAEQISAGTECSAFQKAEQDIADRIKTILDTALDMKNIPSTITVEDSHTKIEQLQSQLLELIQEKDSLLRFFSTPNPWLTRFTELPDDFVLNRELSKKLIDRIYIYRDGHYDITFQKQKDKQRLLEYLPQI